MISRLQTFFWYLQRPTLYSHLLYQLKQLFFPHPLEKTRHEATKWCSQISISTIEALETITGKNLPKKLEYLYPEHFNLAKTRIKELPVKMGGGADLELLYYLTEFINAKTVVETGVASGWSSFAFLLSLKNREGAHLYSADIPYVKLNSEKFVGCVVTDNLKDNWSLVKLPDQQALRKICANIKEIDLFHYDSDKSYRGRMWAYPYIWKKMRHKGIFISDDINDNFAFKNFAKELGITPLVVYHQKEKKYIGILIKS
ncbi:MAG: class I SAM-dependent methyltransferase [Flavobacteriaceae bacterium]|nr:class I SAM-dependent methyltransferase [Flavobacteriaceae bacterium]